MIVDIYQDQADHSLTGRSHQLLAGHALRLCWRVTAKHVGSLRRFDDVNNRSPLKFCILSLICSM